MSYLLFISQRSPSLPHKIYLSSHFIWIPIYFYIIYFLLHSDVYQFVDLAGRLQIAEQYKL
jgi:hypothetical protein